MVPSDSIAMSLRNVGIRYHRGGRRSGRTFWPFRNITVDIMHGETLGIIGRNGAGKSTLLRVMAGILAPDEGEVVNYAGQASLFSLQVGFIPHLVGRENVILSAMLMGLTRKEAHGHLESIIAYSGLGDFIDEPTCNYSSGMTARLGFAVAYHAAPAILLVDEVLGVGDAAFQQQSAEAMRERIKSDRTVVIVSHNMKTVGELCSRVLWIENGTPLLIGEPGEVIDEYIRAIVKSRQSSLG